MARNGTKTGGGNRKGTPNKATAELKDMIRAALDQAGGAEYLYRQALENPVAFMALLGKILPKDINANLDGQVRFDRIEWTFGDPPASDGKTQGVRHRRRVRGLVGCGTVKRRET